MPPSGGATGGKRLPVIPPSPGARGPAGEVTANSRRPRDEGGEGAAGRPRDEGGEAAAARPGYGYAFPGVPGTGTHYHVLVPDAGRPEAALAGGTTERCVALRVFRAKRAPDGALAVRDALAAAGRTPEILDPVTSGGCGDASDHGAPGTGLRAPPPVRVVRVRIASGDLGKADAAIAAVSGLERLLEARLGGAPAEEVVYDVHVVERE